MLAWKNAFNRQWWWCLGGVSPMEHLEVEGVFWVITVIWRAQLAFCGQWPWWPMQQALSFILPTFQRFPGLHVDRSTWYNHLNPEPLPPCIYTHKNPYFRAHTHVRTHTHARTHVHTHTFWSALNCLILLWSCELREVIHSEIEGAWPWVESVVDIWSANSTHLHPPVFVALHFPDSRCGCRLLSASENLQVLACPSVYIVKPVLLLHYK